MKVKLNRILVVEDSDDDLELTLDALMQNKVVNAFDVARDGAEALDYIFKRGKWVGRVSGNPAVILLDLKLPKVTGLEFLKTIRQHEEYRYIPVVILTSSHEEQDVINGYKLGTNAYVVKPVEFDRFVEAVGLLGAFWGIVNEPPSNE
jgi:CheY-like chemotaxis protein